MMLDIKIAFNALANGDNASVITLAKQRMDEFKKMSFEEKYQTLLRLAVELGDPGIVGDVARLDGHIKDHVARGWKNYFNEDEFALAKETLKIDGIENPSDEDVVLRLRTDYRGEAPQTDEPLKLTLIYDHFRTDRWVIRPEEALLFLEVPEGADKDLVAIMDCALVSSFGKPYPPVAQ